MKKTFKILTVLVVAIMMISFTTNVFASEVTPTELKSAMDNAIKDQNTTELTLTAGKVMAVIRNVSIIAAVIILMVIGVKFMLGSTEEKAEYKKSLLPLIIGIVLVVAATSIASFIFGVM